MSNSGGHPAGVTSLVASEPDGDRDGNQSPPPRDAVDLPSVPRPRAPPTLDAAARGAAATPAGPLSLDGDLTAQDLTTALAAAVGSSTPPLPSNITGLISFKLGLDATNFSRWCPRSHERIILKKFKQVHEFRDQSINPRKQSSKKKKI